MSTQKALFLLQAKGDWAVGERDIPTPGSGEILVEVHAAALNPVDWMVQAFDSIIDQYPTVLGSDAAGVVKALGDGVTNFAVGDRVLHQGFFTNDKATFQQYAVVPAEIAAKIPDNLSFDQAATIPLAIATPALSFYNPKPLGAGLEPPWEEAGRGKYAGQPILIIGGAASVGQQAIQLAKLSGFSPIITTASSTHESYLKSLGATHIIDRAQPLSSLPSTIAQITSTPLLYAYDSIAVKDTQTAAYAALAPGGTLLTVSPPEVDEAQRSADKLILPVIGNVHVESNRPVGEKLYSHLTGLLERGEIKPNNVEVLPDGLNGIPAGLKRLQSGAVRASKLVARPQETK